MLSEDALERLADIIAERVAAKIGARATLCKACAKPVQTAVQACATELGTTLALDLVSYPSDKDLNLEDSITRANLHSGCAFDRWWRVYPRKVNKARARALWDKLGLDAIADDLIEKLEAQVAHHQQWRELRFVPHPTTYLNGEQWNDEIETRESQRDRLARVNGWSGVDGTVGPVRGQAREGVRGRSDASGVATRVLEHDPGAGDEGDQGLSWLRG